MEIKSITEKKLEPTTCYYEVIERRPDLLGKLLTLAMRVAADKFKLNQTKLQDSLFLLRESLLTCLYAASSGDKTIIIVIHCHVKVVVVICGTHKLIITTYA